MRHNETVEFRLWLDSEIAFAMGCGKLDAIVSCLGFNSPRQCIMKVG